MTYLSASMKQTVAVKKIKTMKIQIGKNKDRIEYSSPIFFCILTSQPENKQFLIIHTLNINNTLIISIIIFYTYYFLN